LQVIEIYSHQLLKYNWIDFSSKQRSFYFTKSSRGPYVWHPWINWTKKFTAVSTWRDVTVLWCNVLRGWQWQI